MKYPNLDIRKYPRKGYVIWEVVHKNGKISTFTVENHKTKNPFLEDRLKYINKHGTMDGY